MITRALRNTIAILLLFLGCSQTVEAKWWNGEWTLRKKIVIDTTDKGLGIPKPLMGAAVLIRLHDGNFQFSSAKEDGSDLRFVASDNKTVLSYRIEKFDSLLGEGFVWLQVPELAQNAQTIIWLYYGNSGQTAVKPDDSKAIFDSQTVLVYHFAQKGTPSVDSSSAKNNAANAGVPAEGSMIGTGVRFDGGQPIIIPPSPSLNIPEHTAMTLTVWVKPITLQANAVLYSRHDGAGSLVLALDNGIPAIAVNGQRSGPGAPVAANSWHHIAAVAEANRVTLYLDGKPYSTLDTGLPALGSPAGLGAEIKNTGVGEVSVPGAGFVGEMDEFEISKQARSSEFVAFQAANQGGDKDNKLLSFGEDEQTSSWFSGGYFGIILKSLSADGWVVIGILMIMAVMSWLVMVNKISYLNGISKGNAVFLKEWKRVSSDLTALDEASPEGLKTLSTRLTGEAEKTMRNASVYRIYHIGVEEIRHRLAEDGVTGGSRKGLAGRSIQAIRASLDAGLVRENQKINKLIVLLTICISGGPFLGLLGTVVGVMITFAAIAAAGDVNVNAIAPGIAAALVATVAGLAVAIPALFGYNYIISRVKDARDDMHIFIDEFVTKMAEFYRETPEAGPNSQAGVLQRER